MTIAKTLTHHRIPGRSEVALTNELAKGIRDRFNKDRENRFQIYLIAAGLRKRYLNKRTKEYSDEFREWFDKHLKKLFGSLPNFTKYASAGDVVAYVAANTSDPDKYLDQLPLSVGTLYEISQILTGNGEDIFKLCLQYTAKRKSKNSPKHEWTTKRPPLINAHQTESKVRIWRHLWDNPPEKKKRTDKRTLLMGQLFVSGELFDFDKKTGDKKGCVDFPQVDDLYERIRSLLTEANDLQFKFEENYEYLSDGYEKRRNRYDPAARILNLSSAKKTRRKRK